MRTETTTHGDRAVLFAADASELKEWRVALSQSARGRLRRDGELGAGGMATVESVFDTVLHRRVARKTLRPELQTDPGILWLFVRETRVTAQLDHPAIVPVYDVDEDEQGRFYFTMKRVEGKNLDDFIQELPPGPLSRRRLFELLEVLVKVCDAMAFAHSHGVVHCDLKPEHVVVGDFGQVYIMDWGIARVNKSVDGALSGVGGPSSDRRPLIFGTPEYMAPEQAFGCRSDIDERTDVFALGAILYDILLRRPPYEGETFEQVLAQAQQGRFERPSELALPGIVPPELELVVLRAMALAPEERYASVRELADDLRRYMRGEGQFPTMRFAPGEQIVREGDVSDAAYIIADGACRAYRGTGLERRELRVMGPGDVFGELAMLAGEARTADVVASDAGAELYVVTQAVFQREMRSLKPWLSDLVHTLARRFRGLEQE